MEQHPQLITKISSYILVNKTTIITHNPHAVAVLMANDARCYSADTRSIKVNNTAVYQHPDRDVVLQLFSRTNTSRLHVQDRARPYQSIPDRRSAARLATDKWSPAGEQESALNISSNV